MAEVEVLLRRAASSPDAPPLRLQSVLALRGRGIRTLEQLRRATLWSVANIPRIGPACFQEVYLWVVWCNRMLLPGETEIYATRQCIPSSAGRDLGTSAERHRIPLTVNPAGEGK